MNLTSTRDNRRAVVVFATWAYRNILSNWVSVAPRFVRQDLVVYAYGLIYPMILRLLGHSVVWVSIKKPTRSTIWRDRVNAIEGQLKISAQVVVCDADALVLSDFADDIDQIEADLIVSQGLGHPQASFDAWDGFTLCCGFAVYRSSARTITFMEKVAAFSVEAGYDDQVALSTVLLENNLVWDHSKTQYFIQDHKRRIRCFPESLAGEIAKGNLPGLKVVLLPHASYRRMPNSLESINPKVFHPLPRAGGARGVELSFKENGLWRN